ncbi:hypothetical protein C8F04DRAFT_1270207 [Mycena alexandri]|uniref:Uncharacterized protein n=1 Tax=Mycena alexandri TaxID=1745969 RepID=A0AAD6SBI2_9AGAR|nr:hypothetical protein C8F04DRAFT_1270207 [Mycena alexandri]
MRGAKTKFAPDQVKWLEDRWAEFQRTQRKGKLGKFWDDMELQWFEEWPEEEELGITIPAVDDGSAEVQAGMSVEDAKILGDATKKRKALRSWFNNRSQKVKKTQDGVDPSKHGALAIGLFKNLRKRTRRAQENEIWQKRNKAKIDKAIAAAKAEMTNANANTNSSSSSDSSTSSSDNSNSSESDSDDSDSHVAAKSLEAGRFKKTQPKEKLTRVGRSAAMAVRRRVVRELFEKETTEEKESVAKLYREQKASTGDESFDRPAEERTPVELQAAIDELPAIIGEFHAAIFRLTGWMGVTVLGGPTPEEGGAITQTTYSSGQSPAGLTLPASLPDWPRVLQGTGQWLKRLACNARETRKQRALPKPSKDAPSHSPVEPSPPVPIEEATLPPKKTAKASKPAKPKKISKKMAAATAKASAADFAAICGLDAQFSGPEVGADFDDTPVPSVDTPVSSVDPRAPSADLTLPTNPLPNQPFPVDGDGPGVAPNLDYDDVGDGHALPPFFANEEDGGSSSGLAPVLDDGGDWLDPALRPRGDPEDTLTLEELLERLGAPLGGTGLSQHARGASDSPYVSPLVKAFGAVGVQDTNPDASSYRQLEESVASFAMASFGAQPTSAPSPSRSSPSTTSSTVLQPASFAFINTTPTRPAAPSPSQSPSSTARKPTSFASSNNTTATRPSTPSPLTTLSSTKLTQARPAPRPLHRPHGPSPLRTTTTPSPAPAPAPAASTTTTPPRHRRLTGLEIWAPPPPPPHTEAEQSHARPPLFGPGPVFAPPPGPDGMEDGGGGGDDVLDADRFPESRPPCKPPAGARGGAARGRGALRGARGRGGTGRGASRGGGGGGRSITGKTAVQLGYTFMQTYDDDGNAVALPMDTVVQPARSAAESKRIREVERKGKTAPRKNPLHNPDGFHDLVVFPGPNAGPNARKHALLELPAEQPEGSKRIRRATTRDVPVPVSYKPTVVPGAADAAQAEDDAKWVARFKAVAEKRKRGAHDDENTVPAAKK